MKLYVALLVSVALSFVIGEHSCGEDVDYDEFDAGDEAAYDTEEQVQDEERVQDEEEYYPNTDEDDQQAHVDIKPNPGPHFDTELHLDMPSGKKVAMWPGVRVGYVRKLHMEEGGVVRTFYMKTLSLNPPIFEIPNYLSNAECEFIKRQGVKYGLYPSDSSYLDGTPDPEVKNDLVTDLSLEEADQLFRYSDQTWIPNDDLEPLIRRSRIITQLPPAIHAEQLQVVKYRHHGHYESHTDSEATEQGPCCGDPRVASWKLIDGFSAIGKDPSVRCRLCRFATMLYFLHDTPQGGGTVFPLADTTDEELQDWRRSRDPAKFKQTLHCEPGLAVPPSKGAAILWYNHKIDRGYLGELNIRSLHGGCNVYEGEKWISNHWFRAYPHPDNAPTRATSHNRPDDYDAVVDTTEDEDPAEETY